MRRRRVVMVVGGLALLVAGCSRLAPAVPPACPNGRFPATALVAVTPQCQVVTEISDQLQALLAAANNAGVGLAPETNSYLPPGTPGPPRIESCYRSYDMQVWWRNYYCSIDKCGNAATPGTSKHGLGHAVDFEDRDGELTFTSPGYQWLAANAAHFGFSQPPNQQQSSPNAEAWHWEAG
jgi:D-alanyl-D-alanine carboxypeptidase